MFRTFLMIFPLRYLSLGRLALLRSDFLQVCTEAFCSYSSCACSALSSLPHIWRPVDASSTPLAFQRRKTSTRPTESWEDPLLGGFKLIRICRSFLLDPSSPTVIHLRTRYPRSLSLSRLGVSASSIFSPSTSGNSVHYRSLRPVLSLLQRSRSV